jgi:RNA polymerase sigma factor (sigma-70 family)
MVLGVCRRAAASEQDAEDAFQATFLVLVRKAASVVPRDLVGNWLFGVACRTARKVNAAAARRRAKEKQVKVMPEPFVEPDEDVAELGCLLDQELVRLPEKYRIPVVLCELEGKPRKEVARQLRLPEGTLSSRLATARRMLATRLRRRGLALTGGAVAVALARNAAAAGVTPALAGSAVKTAALAAAGRTVAGAVSAQAAAVAERVLKGMLVAKLRALTVGLLAFVIVGVVAIDWRRSPRAGAYQEPLSAANYAVPALAPPPNQPGPERPIIVFLCNAGGEVSEASLAPSAPMSWNTSAAAHVSVNLSLTTSPDPPAAELVIDQPPSVVSGLPLRALAGLVDQRGIAVRTAGIRGPGVLSFFPF